MSLNILASLARATDALGTLVWGAEWPCSEESVGRAIAVGCVYYACSCASFRRCSVTATYP